MCTVLVTPEYISSNVTTIFFRSSGRGGGRIMGGEKFQKLAGPEKNPTATVLRLRCWSYAARFAGLESVSYAW